MDSAPDHAPVRARLPPEGGPIIAPMYAPLRNDSFLRACWREPTDHTPVWLMRQAGRYLPEYRATRARAGSFMGLATNTDYATEVTLQPLERYPLDAAILFSDILTIPDAMGLGLSFALGEGPQVRPSGARRGRGGGARGAGHGQAALRLRRRHLDPPRARRARAADRLCRQSRGRSPATWSKGAGSDDYRLVKTMLYARPDLMHRMLAVNADAVAQYLNAQIAAGAQAVMIFDSWGGVLADGAFQQFSLAYTERVLRQLTPEHDGVRIPRIVFTKGGGGWLEQMADARPGGARRRLDGRISAAARRRVGDRVALQGNLDPNVLFAPPAAIDAEVARLLESFGPVAPGERAGHIFNLGHGISQHTPPEHVTALVEAVHRHSRRLRAD